jgi:segregation and condensation protein B
MFFKFIENFFQGISGFIRSTIINRLRRGRADLEDQQLKSEDRNPQPVQEQPQKPAEGQPLGPASDQESKEEHPAENQPLQSLRDQQRKPAEHGQVQPGQDQQLKSAIESLLFIAGNPLSLDRFKGIFEEASNEQIEEQMNVLRQEYETRGSGIMLVEVAGGYLLATRPENAAWIRKFRSVKAASRLSKPALETLAIVAYKQPITRTEVEAIRGVNIGGIVRNLMERRLVKIVGKKDVPGKPMLYGTTPEFLQYFGLKDLSSLPTLKEFQELEAGEEVMEEIPAEGAETLSTEEATAAEAEATQTNPVGAAATRETSTG